MDNTLTAEEILCADDVVLKSVEVREWSGSVWMRSMTAAQRDDFELAFAGENKTQGASTNLRARYLSKCLCDENGALLFGNDPEKVKELGDKNGRIIDMLFEVARDLNGQNDNAIEDAEKN